MDSSKRTNDSILYVSHRDDKSHGANSQKEIDGSVSHESTYERREAETYTRASYNFRGFIEFSQHHDEIDGWISLRQDGVKH